jgi:hypothetical protein
LNLIILTNTDVYEKDITDFLESINLKKPIPGKQLTTNDKNKVQLIKQPAPIANGFAFT